MLVIIKIKIKYKTKIFFITGAKINPIAAITEVKITYGTWLEMWSRCLHPEPVEVKSPILATGEQFTPEIEPDNIAPIESAMIKGSIKDTTFAIIGINIPKVAHDEPIENDKNIEITKETKGTSVSERLHEEITLLM